MKDSKFVTAAQSGGVSKGVPAKGSDAIGKGSGLKTAWKDQTARPSVMVPLTAAKQKVR